MELIPEFSLDVDEKFIIVPRSFLRGSGIGRTDDDTHLFMRRSCWDQIDFTLTKIVQNKFGGSIYGQPGTGKSLLSYVVAGKLSREWTVVWMHIDFDDASLVQTTKCVIMHEGSKVAGEVPFEDTVPFLDACIRRYSENILVILDGTTNDSNLSSLISSVTVWWNRDPEKRRFLKVSSMAKMGKTKDSRFSRYPSERFLQVSWSFEEYEEALKNEDFARNVDRFLDASPQPNSSGCGRMASKYFFAGGSARYMFFRQTHEVMRSLNNAIKSLQCLGPSGLFSVGILSNVFTYKLISVFSDDNYEIVSQFAAYQMALEMGPNRILQLANDSSFRKIPYMNGAFFELYFFAHTRLGVVNLRSDTGRMISWTCERNSSYFFAEFPDPEDCSQNKWLMPIKWNQPGYDCVFLYQSSPEKENIIRFVQVTTAATHDLKLRYFSDLIEAFEKRGVFVPSLIEIIFIVPTTIQSDFRIGKIENPEALARFDWPTTPAGIRSRIPILGLEFNQPISFYSASWTPINEPVPVGRTKRRRNTNPVDAQN